MKKLFYAAFAIAMVSCNNGGDADGQGSSDSITTISPDTGFTGRDTTGLDVRAAQPPVDSSDTLRDPMENEPGARKSGVLDEVRDDQ